MKHPPTVSQVIAAKKRGALAIADMRSGVHDNGRRGAPKPGCDCVQCFGYCQYDADKAGRVIAERSFGNRGDDDA